MNKEDLESKDEKYKERIVETLHSYRWLGIAYALKEALGDFYKVGNARHAGYFLKYIYIYCLKSENEDIVSPGKMLENHYDGIVMCHTQIEQRSCGRYEQCHPGHGGYGKRVSKCGQSDSDDLPEEFR